MDFLLKALGIGLTIAGAKKIKHNIGEEIKRKNTICRFDGGISKEEFYTMVKCGGKGIRRITSLYAVPFVLTAASPIGALELILMITEN